MVKAAWTEDLYDVLGVTRVCSPEQIAAAYKQRLGEVEDSAARQRINEAFETLQDPERRKEYDAASCIDHYRVLGVPRDASASLIAKQFRRLARRAHPDKGGDPRVYAVLSEAQRVLLDPEARAQYDRAGHVEEEAPCRIRVDRSETGRGVFAEVSLGVGEAVLWRDKPYLAVPSREEGARRRACLQCLAPVMVPYKLRDEYKDVVCDECNSVFCAKCTKACPRHAVQCAFCQFWEEDKNPAAAITKTKSKRGPPDIAVWLVHALQVGLPTAEDLPLVPINASPVGIPVPDLQQDGDVSAGRMLAQTADSAKDGAEAVAVVARFVAKHETTKWVKGKGSEKGSPPEDCKRDLQELLARYKCNAVLTHSESLGNAGRRIPSAAALYQAGSIFNHSCAPNCAATYEESLLSIRTIRPVKEGEELTVSYVDESATTVQRRAELWRRYRFFCCCRRCTDPAERDRDALASGWLARPPSREVLTDPQESDPSQMRDTFGDLLFVPDKCTKELRDVLFLPSEVVGYCGERKGFTYRQGSVGPGYYGAENLAPGTYLSALDLAQQDKYEARALFTLAETLRFTITRNAPSMDKQVAAKHTATYTRSILVLLLRCVHPTHLAVGETLRLLARCAPAVNWVALGLDAARCAAVHSAVRHGRHSKQHAADAASVAQCYLGRGKETDYASAVVWAARAVQTARVLYGKRSATAQQYDLLYQAACEAEARHSEKMSAEERVELAGAEAGAEALIAGATEEEAEAAAEAARSAAREEEQNRWVLMTLDGDVEPLGPPPAWAAHVDPLALERGSPLLQRLYRFLGAFSGGEEDPWLADQETGDVSLGFPVEVPQDCLHCGKTGAVPCEGCGCAAFCAPPMRCMNGAREFHHIFCRGVNKTRCRIREACRPCAPDALAAFTPVGEEPETWKCAVTLAWKFLDTESMTLRMTLPVAWKAKPVSALVDLFLKKYAEKHAPITGEVRALLDHRYDETIPWTQPPLHPDAPLWVYLDGGSKNASHKLALRPGFAAPRGFYPPAWSATVTLVGPVLHYLDLPAAWWERDPPLPTMEVKLGDKDRKLRLVHLLSRCDMTEYPEEEQIGLEARCAVRKGTRTMLPEDMTLDNILVDGDVLLVVCHGLGPPTSYEGVDPNLY